MAVTVWHGITEGTLTEQFVCMLGHVVVVPPSHNRLTTVVGISAEHR